MDYRKLKLVTHGPWPGGSAGQSVVPTHQACRFNCWSGHIREPASESTDKWDKLASLSNKTPEPGHICVQLLQQGRECVRPWTPLPIPVSSP